MKVLSKRFWPWILLATIVLALPVVLLANPSQPEEKVADTEALHDGGWGRGLGYIGAALAVGLGSLGAGFAVGPAAAAAVGAVAEKEETAGKSLVFVGVAEGIAIYGLVIAIMILNRL